ncbi:hypothetical protein AB6A40_009464 [Gnathostoma spinigerum]|uniref:Uncharacterized protein n=1 Tax=Gnathostoma spinigerum TaxID=75299 RepID=A0ABD6F1M4_9BILA
MFTYLKTHRNLQSLYKESEDHRQPHILRERSYLLKCFPLNFIKFFLNPDMVGNFSLTFAFVIMLSLSWDTEAYFGGGYGGYGMGFGGFGGLGYPMGMGGYGLGFPGYGFGLGNPCGFGYGGFGFGGFGRRKRSISETQVGEKEGISEEDGCY